MLKAVSGTASVVLHGRTVGELRFAAGGCAFHYTDDLLAPHHSVLGQMFEEEPRRVRQESVGLPSWFANLLPEQGSGLRRFYAALFDRRQLDDARLLLTLGDDLPGAATVLPVDIPPEGVLVDQVAARVHPGGVHLSALAGAQPKMSVQRDGTRLTLPGRGETGGWIVKFASGAYPSLAENEYLMMRWVAEAGLDVPAVDLLPAASAPNIFDELRPGSLAYLVERFDRAPDGRRVHIEDLAQVTGTLPELRFQGASYDGIGALVRALTGEAGFEEYLRRLVAMVVMGNGDAHLKNWSLRYPDGRTPTTERCPERSSSRSADVPGRTRSTTRRWCSWRTPSTSPRPGRRRRSGHRRAATGGVARGPTRAVVPRVGRPHRPASRAAPPDPDMTTAGHRAGAT